MNDAPKASGEETTQDSSTTFCTLESETDLLFHKGSHLNSEHTIFLFTITWQSAKAKIPATNWSIRARYATMYRRSALCLQRAVTCFASSPLWARKRRSICFLPSHTETLYNWVASESALKEHLPFLDRCSLQACRHCARTIITIYTDKASIPHCNLVSQDVNRH